VFGYARSVIASIFVRRLKPGATFADFLREWQADVGFGVPTRVINAPGVTDPREVLTVGFIDITRAELDEWLAAPQPTEQVRHERIDTVIESTVLRGMFEVESEHDFTGEPIAIELGSPESLLARLRG
jgi:hypothetical protein